MSRVVMMRCAKPSAATVIIARPMRTDVVATPGNHRVKSGENGASVL